MTPAVETYATLAARVLTGPARCGPVRLVAVDGPGGAGKSTLAARLATALGGVPVVHTDDFATGDGTDWWPRLEEQVLRPLGAGTPGRYRRWDADRRAFAGWHDVPLAPAVVLEGVSAARRAVTARLSLALWIETARAVRLRRGLLRDGPGAAELWPAWMAEEDAHYAHDRAAERADVVVDGAPDLPHDPEKEYVRVVRKVRIAELDLADGATAAAVHALGRRAYAVEARLIGFDGIPALGETEDELRRRPLRWLGALTAEGTPAAFLAWENGPGTAVVIDRLCVDPERFRQGLASRLLHRLLDGPAAGRPVEVATGAANLPAVALYTRFGFARAADFEPVPGLTMARFTRSGPA